MSPLVLIALFIVSSVVGYKVISAVPSLLHTPLMSGTNALSGVTILGALVSTAVARSMSNPVLAQAAGFVAIVFAMVNVDGGFLVTDRMLRMFHK